MSDLRYYNSTNKCCRTCVFCSLHDIFPNKPRYDYCLRFHKDCIDAMSSEKNCGLGLSYWKPRYKEEEKKNILERILEFFGL